MFPIRVLRNKSCTLVIRVADVSSRCSLPNAEESWCNVHLIVRSDFQLILLRPWLRIELSSSSPVMDHLINLYFNHPANKRSSVYRTNDVSHWKITHSSTLDYRQPSSFTGFLTRSSFHTHDPLGLVWSAHVEFFLEHIVTRIALPWRVRAQKDVRSRVFLVFQQGPAVSISNILTESHDANLKCALLWCTPYSVLVRLMLRWAWYYFSAPVLASHSRHICPVASRVGFPSASYTNLHIAVKTSVRKRS
jgi:hypothetical protein